MIYFSVLSCARRSIANVLIPPIQRNQSSDHETKMEKKSPQLKMKLFKRKENDGNEEVVGDMS